MLLKCWWQNIRHDIPELKIRNSLKRPIELERRAKVHAFAIRFKPTACIHLTLLFKAQPEIMLEWYRALAHAHAISCDQCRRRCTGLGCTSSNRLAERDQSELHGQLRGTNNWGADLFELDVEGEIVVKPLGRRLQFVPPERVKLICNLFLFSSIFGDYFVIGVECR
jgi:hypothetical protein